MATATLNAEAENEPTLAEQIRDSRETHKAVDATLRTSERILARITDGIYRQPASALRELISNAYDADATEVVILTDAPRFSTISIRDNGLGLSPESLEHFLLCIGDSAKRSEEGSKLKLASEGDVNKTPSGRQFIGKMGIGLFSVAQFTRHFLIITKTCGDNYQTIADVTLGPIDSAGKTTDGEITTGHVRVWQEPAPDTETQGTEIKLLELLPRTRAELSSQDMWMRIDYASESPEETSVEPPIFHIGRINPQNPDDLLIQPTLPWSEQDDPKTRFKKFVYGVRKLAETDSDLVDLEKVCDKYLQTLWTLSLAAPLDYLEEHPFDLTKDSEILFFQLENKTRGQAKELLLGNSNTLRSSLKLGTPWLNKGDAFDVTIDGVQLLRPIIFRNQIKTSHAIKNSLLFAGRCRETFEGKPVALTGGSLEFEAYLFWTPKIVPTQHQGVMIRVGNASGPPFDSRFMDYQVSEQTRLRQITAEIFVREGLDGAINLDRESFNYAHPHYQFLVKWLHSAIRQLTNRNKELGKKIRTTTKALAGVTAQAKLAARVGEMLQKRGVEDTVEVTFAAPGAELTDTIFREQGAVVLHKGVVIPPSQAERHTSTEKERTALTEKKAIAITQILHSWGVLEKLSFEDQEKLVAEILEVAEFEVA